MSLEIHVAGQSDIGCVRKNNEDCFGYDEDCGIYIVCDGMGGAAAGEVASRIAVDSVLEFCRRAATTESSGPTAVTRAATLSAAIEFANQQIYYSAQQYPERRGMGSTIAAVLVDGETYSVAHAGDSRVYLFRQGSIEQLTEDHSLVMEQLRRGLITAEQALHSEVQNIITRALGTERSVQVDLRDLSAAPGDTLLLASDGLTRHISDAEILKIVSRASSATDACAHLVAAAREAGGLDNITCLILHFADKSQPSSKKSWLRNLVSRAPGEAHE